MKTVSVKHNGVSMTTANLASMIAEVIRDEIIEVRRCCHFLACTVKGVGGWGGNDLLHYSSIFRVLCSILEEERERDRERKFGSWVVFDGIGLV